MKIKNLFLALSVLCTCFSTSHAQVIRKVKVLFFSFSNTEFPFVHSDSVMVSKISNDTTWFKTSVSYPSGQGFYYKAGQKIYKKESTKDILLYDYSLGKGDIFILHTNSFLHDTLIVDSVYLKKMNHRTFKAWHLTVKNYTGGRKYLEWIEGLGDLRVGWDTKHYYFADGGWEVKGLCLNDSILYWDTTYNYFKDRNPLPSCMFDSISKRLSVQSVANINFSIYPNPASDMLTVNSESGGILCISDYTGKGFMEHIAINAGAQIIDISILKPGFYLLSLQSGRSVIYKKICIINHQ